MKHAVLALGAIAFWVIVGAAHAVFFAALMLAAIRNDARRARER